MTSHPAEPRRRGPAGGSDPAADAAPVRRRPRPVGDSSLWDAQGSPSIHAADARTPRVGRPASTRRGSVGRRQPGGTDAGSADQQAVQGRPDDRGQDREKRAGVGRVAAPVTDRERAARRAALAAGSAVAGDSGAPSRRPPPGRTSPSGRPPGRNSPSGKTPGGDASGRKPPGRTPPGRSGRGNRWRMLLIPVLVVLTVVVIFRATSSPADTAVPSAPTFGSTAATTSTPATAAVIPEPTADPTAAASAEQTALPGAVPDLTIRDADGHLAASIGAGALPAGPEFVAAGAGTWHVVPGTAPTYGTGPEAHTYSVEVEDGLQSVEQDAAFASAVDANAGRSPIVDRRWQRQPDPGRHR